MLTFKQIQLIGFKSFAEKTVIPLGDGVTCIVGPNGCGKSNVADAIRWVLGEQSPKMMRGSQMMDVIFNGTEKRRKMSFCEVTLTFDNSQKIFNTDSEEVEMTRRLYRDGTSEYLLNREKKRMRDLTDLLHGAGAAKEGYSIIGQGRIEQIMNARPEDRRSIFEEATGIIVLKDRKNEAERKLAASKDNLYLFVQTMKELEKRLPILKQQAENALIYREIEQNLRVEEANAYIVLYEKSDGEKQGLVNAGKLMEERIKELEARNEELIIRYRKSQDELSAADVEAQELNERIRIYEVGIEHNNGESRVFTEKANSARTQLADAQEKLAYSSKRIEEIDREISRSQSQMGKNVDEVELLRKKGEALQARIGELSAKITEYEVMTGEHRKKILETFKDLSEMSENIGSLSARKELLLERVSEIEAEMSAIRAERDKMAAEYDQCLKKNDETTRFLDNENSLLEEAENKVAECENKVQFIIRQIYDAQAQLLSFNESLSTYRALREKFTGYIHSVQKLMSDSRENAELSSRIMGLIADIVTCGKEYEVAIETAFGGAMQNIITRTRDDAKYLIEYLKRTRGGQITCLPVEALKPRYENDEIRSAVRETGAIGFAIDLVKFDKKFENVIHNLLGNTLVVDNIANATVISRRYPRAFKIVTLDGDVIAVSGSMTGGSRRDAAGNLLANERIIKELEENVSAKEAFLARADGKKSEAENARVSASEELVSLRKRLEDCRVELAAITQKQTVLLQNIASSESRYAAYGELLSTVQGRLKGLDSEYSGASGNADDLKRRSDETSAQIDDMSAEYDKLVAARGDVTTKLNAINVEIASLESARKTGAENIERLKEERKSVYDDLESLTAKIPQIQAQVEQFIRQAEHSALNAEEQAAVDSLREKIAKVAERKSELNALIKQTDVERTANEAERDKLLDRRHKIDIAVTKLETELENATRLMSEEYGEDYEGCLKYKVENYEYVGSKERIRSLKIRRDKLRGNLNANAVEEYEEASADYEHKLVEKEDLEKGVADLQFALDDIRSEMLTKFEEGFNKINANFSRTFKELFGGGHAELELDYTDCDDPLDAGVEITACPPGKKLTKISLLSGGERALTAIAILFAIIGMRPMPFCVLDEIEAALDEANVARYARYLKKFAENTQFIVITHRKPTMEEADVLFGVTMEEKGVSKIVSVKLSEVEERLGGDTVM